jgi:septal ring factor EnvC (AmiA/AmiB activator)
MLENSYIKLRLKHLEDNIEQDLNLRKQYEDTLRFEDEPRRKAKYQREIEQLRESANRYQQELDELQKQIASEPTVHMQAVAIQLQQINTKLNRLSAGQKAIYENINHLRQGLLTRYKASCSDPQY